MTARPGCLVDGQLPDFSQVTCGDGEIHITLADRHDSVDRQSGNARHAAKRHLQRQHQHQGLEQEREARQLAGPIGPNLPDAAIGQLDARYPHVEKALVLEEIEMSVALDDGVMDGMFSINFSHLEATAAFEVDLDLEDLLGLIEVINPAAK